MTEVPKIVYDRLRAALPKRALPDQTGPERAHPDADVLTAFAEQALSATERDRVLEHLALCGDCRELIALALPAADLVAAPTAVAPEAAWATVPRAGASAPHKLSFAGPTLRWATLAAGVAVAAAVLLMLPGKLNQVALPSANRTAAPAASGPQIAAAPAAGAPAVTSPVATPSTDQLAVLAKAEEPPPKPELRPSEKLKAGQVVMPPHQVEHGILLADNKKDSGQADKPSAALPAQSLAIDASARRRATETGEVSGAAAVEVAPSAEGGLMARNETPAIEKAKPALQEMGANDQQKTQAYAVPGTAKLQARNLMSATKLVPSASPALARNVTWAITAGILQRSLDNGQSWQRALRANHPLLCYATHDDDVWVGGQAGTLFHSANGGVTWELVQPSVKTQSLTSDITHIDARGQAEIVVSTSNGEIWSSGDCGKTWEKK